MGNDEISTVDAAWQSRILAATSGTKATPRKNFHRTGPTLPWEVYSLLFGIFWIVLALLIDEGLVLRLCVMFFLGGPFVALFVWRTFFHTRNWIIDIRLFEQAAFRWRVSCR